MMRMLNCLLSLGDHQVWCSRSLGWEMWKQEEISEGRKIIAYFETRHCWIMNDMNYEHHLHFQVVISWENMKKVSFFHLFFPPSSVMCVYKIYAVFLLLLLLPLTPLCEPFNLAVLEPPGETGCEDTCCHDDCGTLKVPWCFPLVSTCLRRLRAGRSTVLPGAPAPVPGHEVPWCENERELPACTRMWGTCCPVVAPRDFGMLVGETKRLQPFPFISLSSALGKETKGPEVSCCKGHSRRAAIVAHGHYIGRLLR